MNKETQKINPILKAYLFSTGAFLVPSWISSALVSNPDPATGTSDLFMWISLSLFALTCWSPSVGLFMFKKKWYAILGGAGRVAAIALCVLADREMLKDLPPGEGHAYLTFLGILIALTWGIVDFVLIYFFGKKHLESQNEGN